MTTATETNSRKTAWGRLSEVDFGGGVTDDFNDTYQYLYSYNTAGRVTSQQMNIAPEPCPYCFALGGQQTSAAAWAAMTANYQWDNEGRMTSLQYPTVNLPHQQTGAAVSY
jgi:hypothetical protein